MLSVEEIKKNYSKLSTEKLISIAGEPEKLRNELIPILQAELAARGEADEKKKIADYSQAKEEKEAFLEAFDANKFVNEQLAQGIPMDTIKLQLQDLGVDINKMVEEERKSEEEVLDYIEKKKGEKVSKESLETELKEKFDVNETSRELLESKLRRRGNLNLFLGISLVFVVVISSLYAFGRGGSIGVMMYVLFCLGIWRIGEGVKQKRKLK